MFETLAEKKTKLLVHIWKNHGKSGHIPEPSCHRTRGTGSGRGSSSSDETANAAGCHRDASDPLVLRTPELRENPFPNLGSAKKVYWFVSQAPKRRQQRKQKGQKIWSATLKYPFSPLSPSPPVKASISMPWILVSTALAWSPSLRGRPRCGRTPHVAPRSLCKLHNGGKN